MKSAGNSNNAPLLAGANGDGDDMASNRALLNTSPEFVLDDSYSDFEYWETNYDELQNFTGDAIKVSDTFLNEVPANPADLENFVLDVDYHAVLYIHDTVEDLYYPVSSLIIPITWDLSSEEVITGVTSIDADNRTVAGVEFYNVAGQRMASPNGLTIVVTRFTDGSVMSTKQIFK